jgi:hypothetical protein
MVLLQRVICSINSALIAERERERERGTQNNKHLRKNLMFIGPCIIVIVEE